MGVTKTFSFALQTAKPFNKAVDTNKEELSGAPRIATLGLKYGTKEMILEECVLTISQEKNIVTTPLQGRGGTVKEFVSKGDYSITAAVGITQPSESANYQDRFKYPKNQLKTLYEMLSVDKTIIVDSDFLLVFGIKSAVVQSYSLQQETHTNRQTLSIQMLSDEPYEIKIKKI